jgi:hypothetical protein
VIEVGGLGGREWDVMELDVERLALVRSFLVFDQAVTHSIVLRKG